MKLSKVVFTIGCLIFLMIFISACSSLTRRKPLEVTPYNQQLSLNNLDEINIIFEGLLEDKPLNETVWDNATGPFWSVEESKQIGFTQDYSEFIPIALSAGYFSGAAGGVIAGLNANPELVNTRILIPFGNIFSKTFESAIENNINKYSVCYVPDCNAEVAAHNSLKIKIDEFYVWEGPLNHLNLVVKGNSVYSVNGNIIKKHTIERSLLSQKLGTVLSTHASFIKEMNRISNMLAQEVSTDIINNTIK